MKQPAIYIVASQKNGTIYTGATSNLQKRVYEHKSGQLDGFSKKYNCKMLVYYERYEDTETAILREKQIKGRSRIEKLQLIEKNNPEWLDLYGDLF